MSVNERESKVSGAAAEDEARSLLLTLKREPDRAATLGAELNERYTAAPRKAILAQLRQHIPHTQPPVSADAVHRFLDTQFDGVKDQGFNEQFSEVVAVAVELPGDEGPRIAAEITVKAIGSGRASLIRMGRIPQAASILTLAFEGLVTADKCLRERLNDWTEVAQPCMSVAQSGVPRFKADDATRILAAMCRAERKTLPNSLLACTPSLVLLAGRAGAAQFLSTEVGLPFANALAGMSVSGSGKTVGQILPVVEQQRDLSPREQLSDALKEVMRVFDRASEENARECQNLHEQVEEVERQLVEARHAITERDRQLRILDAEHRDELQQTRERISHLERAEHELKESVERLRADLQLTDHNARHNVAEKEDEQRRRLGELLDSTLESMRRDLERALRQHPENDVIRNVGISFDSLQRKLLREASHLRDTRLPRELLDPNNAK